MNGLLDLDMRTLRPVTPKTGQTWCLPYDYTADADCPTVREWLTRAVDGDTDT
jgi:phage/plasmid-associated DNA primase